MKTYGISIGSILFLSAGLILIVGLCMGLPFLGVKLSRIEIISGGIFSVLMMGSFLIICSFNISFDNEGLVFSKVVNKLSIKWKNVVKVESKYLMDPAISQRLIITTKDHKQIEIPIFLFSNLVFKAIMEQMPENIKVTIDEKLKGKIV